MNKVLITAKSSNFFGKVGEVVEEIDKGYFVKLLSGSYYYTKSQCEVLLPLSEIVKAGEDGKEIETWSNDDWNSCAGMVFFANELYRIKPEPKEQIVPYTWEDRDLLRGLWVKSKDENREIQVIYLAKERIGIGVFTFLYSYEEFCNYFTHLDGSPLGKKI